MAREREFPSEWKPVFLLGLAQCRRQKKAPEVSISNPQGLWTCRQSLSPVPLSVTLKDWGLPASPVHGISQARTLEWAAIPVSRGFFPYYFMWQKDYEVWRSNLEVIWGDYWGLPWGPKQNHTGHSKRRKLPGCVQSRYGHRETGRRHCWLQSGPQTKDGGSLQRLRKARK